MTTPTARQIGSAVHQTRDGQQVAISNHPNPLQGGSLASVSNARGQPILIAIAASNTPHQPQLPSAHSIGAAVHKTKEGQPIITSNQSAASSYPQPGRKLHHYGS